MINKKVSRIKRIRHGCHKLVLKAVRLGIQGGSVGIDEERCKGCELCVNECPAHTLELSKSVNRRGYRHSVQAREKDCIGCASCALVCPDGCITVYRKSLTNRKTI